jgi:formylglycine-generating enzyme required for sulfatase activity
VGDYPSGASPYGALDMSGNVEEWVNDWYLSNYYAVSPYYNPPGPLDGTAKVLRGGSYGDNWQVVRAAVRDGNFPSDPYDRGNDIGFRCAALPGE